MKLDAFSIVNIVLIVVCAVMALVFIFVPIQRKEGLKNYRISLRFLAFSYLSLSVSTLMNLMLDTHTLYFIIDFTAISLQTVLFSISLILLFDVYYANKILVLKYIFPTFLFVVLSLAIKRILDEPVLQTIDDFIQNYTHPLTILNMLFITFCVAQVIYFLLIFIKKASLYKIMVNNYYSETYTLQLRWVKYCFYAAFLFVLLVIVSMFISLPVFRLIMVGIYSLFYIIFGLFYIQYPQTYNIIEPIFSRSNSNQNENSVTNSRYLNWENYKQKVIDEKYYIKQEINIDEMAQFLKIGRTTLSNFINKNEQLNFHAWINTLRINEAQKLILNNPGISITEVSYQVGYSETSHFSRQFKHVTGCSPSIWRQRNINS